MHAQAARAALGCPAPSRPAAGLPVHGSALVLLLTSADDDKGEQHVDEIPVSED